MNKEEILKMVRAEKEVDDFDDERGMGIVKNAFVRASLLMYAGPLLFLLMCKWSGFTDFETGMYSLKDMFGLFFWIVGVHFLFIVSGTLGELSKPDLDEKTVKIVRTISDIVIGVVFWLLLYNDLKK